MLKVRRVLMVRRVLVLLVLLVLMVPSGFTAAYAQSPERPFGTLREQAAMQQDWLKKRLDTFLPSLMRRHGIDLWVVPMREYNEDPVFGAITAPETFAARRRTIYVFFDGCAAAGGAPAPNCIQRIALGGTSQGGVFDARARPRRRPATWAAASRPSCGAMNNGRRSRP